MRAPRDTATAVLASAGVFAAVARYTWSRILRIRTPFQRDADRRLREARGFFNRAYASWFALTLVPVSLGWLERVQEAAEGARWVSVTVSLPIAITFATAALVIVGGAMLLLLLLPVFSVLLWPFGIFPTPAAALLTVSVEEAPTRRWLVMHLPHSGVSATAGWKHSTYRDHAALDAVCTYLRGVVPSERQRKSAQN